MKISEKLIEILNKNSEMNGDVLKRCDLPYDLWFVNTIAERMLEAGYKGLYIGVQWEYSCHVHFATGLEIGYREYVTLRGFESWETHFGLYEKRPSIDKKAVIKTKSLVQGEDTAYKRGGYGPRNRIEIGTVKNYKEQDILPSPRIKYKEYVEEFNINPNKLICDEEADYLIRKSAIYDISDHNALRSVFHCAETFNNKRLINRSS